MPRITRSSTSANISASSRTQNLAPGPRIGKAPPLETKGLYLHERVRRCPTLPGVCTPSTIGADRLNFRVRNGNGWIPVAIATEQHLYLNCHFPSLNGRQQLQELHSEHDCLNSRLSSPRTISTGPLNTLLRLHFRPINLVFYQGPYPVDPVGDLISGWASHLDAFSAYPVRT